MGIPSYFSYIIKNHCKIIKKKEDIVNIDNFYLDSNSIIYDSMRECEYDGNNRKFERELINLVIKKIDNYIRIINPRARVLIAFDGVAPLAKMNQQRTRRYKSELINKIKSKLGEKGEEGWNKSAITPGTDFMINLGNKIRRHYKNRNSVNVSTADDVGEGEHKIFNFIRENPEFHKNAKTVIYGLDADLIMLALNNLKYCDKIYIYRETPEFIKSIDYSFEPNVLYCLDMELLSDAIVFEMCSNNKNRDKNNTLQDYIFICFLLGNDFLPHFPSVCIRTTGINILMSAYFNTISFKNKYLIDTETNNINWGNFKDFIKWLSHEERGNIIKEYDIRNKWGRRRYKNSTMEEKMNKLDNIPTKCRDNEYFIDPKTEGWEKRYYLKLFDIHRSDDYMKKISLNYLEGLEWVFNYYTSGCVDWKWKYNYHYPPLFVDLLEYIPFWNTKMIEDNDNKAVKPHVQLAYVLPHESLNLLPDRIKKLLIEKFSSYYTNDHKLKWEFCRYLWEAHVDFSDIEITDIEKLLE